MNEQYKIGDRVIGCRGSKVEDLIGTVIAVSDVEDKIFVSFIPPSNEEVRAKYGISLNIPMSKSVATTLALGVSVFKDDILPVKYCIDTIKKKYDRYKIRYGFEHDPKKKSDIEAKIHILNWCIKELSNASMVTGFFDCPKYDLRKIIKED